MEREGETYASLAVSKGSIARLFSQPPENPAQLAKRVVDAQGRAVLPGFTDAHVHFMTSAIMGVMGCPISEIVVGRLVPRTFEEVGEKVQAFARQSRHNTPLLFTNFVTASFPGEHLPYREEIDAWLPGRTVFFLSVDGHAASFSSPALEKMGINPAGHSGILTEDMPEFSMDKIVGLVTREITLGLMLRGIAKLLNQAASKGVVAIHCLEGFQADVRRDLTLKFMRLLGGRLPLRMRLYPQVRDPTACAGFFRQMRSPRLGGCGAWEMDGSVGAKTAAFYDPYLGDPDNRGTLLYPQEALRANLGPLYENGTQVTAHAIGTRAIDHLLDAYEGALRDHHDDAGENRLRWRIDHFEFPTQAAIDRAVGKLGLLIVPQPAFNWIDHALPEMHTYEKFLPPSINALQLPLRRIVDQGGLICGSSDSPVLPIDPFLQIHSMVNFPLPAERLGVYEAVRTFTFNPAYATFEDHTRGTLAEGKVADFLLLDSDPFECPPEHLAEIHVAQAFIEGRPWRPLPTSGLGLPIRLLGRARRAI